MFKELQNNLFREFWVGDKHKKTQACVANL